jgi:hypothetical protein
MTELQDNLLYMDKFLDPKIQSEEQRAIVESLEGKDGLYKKMAYRSEQFKDEMAHLFIGPLTTSAELIRLDPEFEKVGNSKLIKILDKIILRSVIHVGAKIRQISPEAWQTGERGNLLEEYSELVSQYAEFRGMLPAKLIQ